MSVGRGEGTFSCIDAHTCGNPVRVVSGGVPHLEGATMLEKRAFFLEHYDWIRKALMFEPRGHDVMSGSILYPPTRLDCDLGILFIEVSGCLPMCGHGTIGTVTVALERKLVTPKVPGVLRLDTPAGLVVAHYEMDGPYVASVRLFNVASYLHGTDYTLDVPGFGALTFDVAYGGNFYAIIEPQAIYRDLDQMSVQDLQRLSPIIRQMGNAAYEFQHPSEPAITGLSHVLWTGVPKTDDGHARNAVFYGDKAIDRSPCGTGTSARMAQLHARGRLQVGEAFHHESIICSLFKGRVEETCKLGERDAIRPSIEGWARITGLNTIFVDERDPFAHGFLVG